MLANLVFKLFRSHTSFSGHPRIEGTGQVILQAAIFADFQLWTRHMSSPPRHQNAFSPSPSKKRSRVAAPGRTVFNSPRARPLSSALRSELQTDRHLHGAHSRRPTHLTKNLRIAQFRERPTTGEAQTRHVSRESDTGCWDWRVMLRPLYSPSAPVNVLLALFPLRSTLTVLDRLGDFALRWHEC